MFRVPLLISHSHYVSGAGQTCYSGGMCVSPNVLCACELHLRTDVNYVTFSAAIYVVNTGELIALK